MLQIIPADRADLHAVLSLQYLAFQSEADRYSPFLIEPMQQTIEGLEEEFSQRIFLKALVDGEIVGSVRGHVKDGTGLIGKLIVHPRYQKQGIGARLMAVIEELLEAEGCVQYELFTGERSEATQRLYTRLGYTPVRMVSVHEELRLVYMAKAVDRYLPQESEEVTFYRESQLEDIPVIVQLKLRMFEESGHSDLLHPDAGARIEETYLRLYEAGTARHLLLIRRGEILGMCGVFLKEDVPFSFYRNERYGFIGDVYIHPDERGQGHAAALTQQALDWLKQEGVEMVRLLATPKGRPLYEKLGFKPTDEMVYSFHEHT